MVFFFLVPISGGFYGKSLDNFSPQKTAPGKTKTPMISLRSEGRLVPEVPELVVGNRDFPRYPKET